jgi:hypothetical protein
VTTVPGSGQTTVENPGKGTVIFVDPAPPPDPGVVNKTVNGVNTTGCRFQAANTADLAKQSTLLAVQQTDIFIKSTVDRVSVDVLDVAADVEDVSNRIGFKQPTQTERCGKAATVKSVQEGIRDLEEKVGIKKGIKRKRPVRNPDGTAKRDPKTGELVRQEKQFCSLGEVVDELLQERCEDCDEEPLTHFIVGYEAPAPPVPYLVVRFNVRRDKIANVLEHTIPRPRPNISAETLRQLGPRRTGKFFCSMRVDDRKDRRFVGQLTGYFESAAAARAWFLKALRLVADGVAGEFTATERGSSPKSAGKPLYPVAAYPYKDGEVGKRVDLREQGGAQQQQ